MKKPPPGYRSPDLIDRRAEFKRAPSTPGERYQKGVRMEENIAKMTARERKNVGTPRNRANLGYALGKTKR